MSSYAPFRVTITQQALADTVVDDSRTSSRKSLHDLSNLPKDGDLVGKQYRLVRLLGQGMFGKVYVAERIDVPEHRVALKMMPREVYAGRNVERELVMLAAAGHPNVVQLKDHGTTDKYVWLTMPVYEGETLSERLERGTLDLAEAYEIFLPIARGVEALHAAGLRHQDLKPENIFLAQFAGRLHPIILDLGVAAEITSTFVAGTILYGAPEQIEALNAKIKLAVTERIDTYGLAATLLLALVGPEQFPGTDAHTREEIAEAQEERATEPLRPEALPGLSGEPRDKLREAFRDWLALEPKNRPPIGQMAEDLDVLLAQQQEEYAAEQRRQARQKSNLRATRVAVAAFLVGALGLLGYAYSKRNTLRLATELARAKAEGAQQFDKLETCVASHRIEQLNASECRSARARDQQDFKKTLEGLSQSNNPEGDCAKQLLTYTTRVRVCEDSVVAQNKACATEKDLIKSEWTTRAGQLAAEIQDQKNAIEVRAKEITQLNAEVDKARAETKACLARVADNPYVEPTAAPPPPPPPRTSAPPPSAPVVPTVAPPTTTPTAVAPPPPPPTPAPKQSS